MRATKFRRAFFLKLSIKRLRLIESTRVRLKTELIERHRCRESFYRAYSSRHRRIVWHNISEEAQSAWRHLAWLVKVNSITNRHHRSVYRCRPFMEVFGSNDASGTSQSAYTDARISSINGSVQPSARRESGNLWVYAESLRHERRDYDVYGSRVAKLLFLFHTNRRELLILQLI